MTDEARIEFFYDLSSPWTYFAFTNIHSILKRTGAGIQWRPILVGGIFNAVNQSVYAARERQAEPKNLSAKDRFSGLALKYWAEYSGIKMDFPNKYHPARSVHAMRFCTVLEDEQGHLFEFSRRAFAAYFVEARNLDDPEVLVQIANDAGLNGEEIREQSVSVEIKQRLRDNTDEVISRGAFGSPTIFVDRTKMYFGNDQLPLVEFALNKSP